MFVELKTRKYVKVKDLAVHVKSGLVGEVKFIAVVDEVAYAIWKPITTTSDKLFLIPANMLHPGRYRTDA